MPASEVIAEPVYEEIPSVTAPPATEETPVPPAGGTPSPSPAGTQKPGNIIPFPYIPVKNVITNVMVASPAEGGKVSGRTEAMEGETITVKAVAMMGIYLWSGRKTAREPVQMQNIHLKQRKTGHLLQY